MSYLFSKIVFAQQKQGKYTAFSVLSTISIGQSHVHSLLQRVSVFLFFYNCPMDYLLRTRASGLSAVEIF